MTFKITTLTFFIFLFTTSIAGAQPGTSWKLTGPDLFPGNTGWQINGIGRVCQVKFHPSDPNKMYAVSASGGLWISDDTAHSWVKTGTDSLPATPCASLCIDYTNDNILYLGTGDPNYYYGTFGIWKSTDAGLTWTQSTSGLGNRLAVEILMDPTDHNTLVAATDGGIFKSINAGLNWTIVKSGGDFKNMKFQPGSDTVLYAVTSSEFWRSGDFGSTWAQIIDGVIVPGGGSGNGMRIAVSAADPNVVYVGMVTDNGTILKSTDKGFSFSTIYHNTSRTIVGYDSTNIGGGQGDYNFGMTCDPTNADHVFLVSHVVWRSLDGGVTWSQMTDWPSQLHTDMHGILFHPVYTNKLFNTNDGGVWLSTDNGDNWVPKSDGLAATEIYHASQSPIKRDMISIGTQDNGELYYSDNEWKTNRGGDWGEYSAFDYLTNDVVYYGNGNRRPVNGGDSYFGLPDTVTKVLEFSKQNTMLAFAGKNEVWRTTGLDASPPTWTQITSINRTIKAINSSPANPNVLYFITSNNKIYRSDNALATTPAYSMYTTPGSSVLYASIAAIKNDSNVVYISCGSRVYRSGDKGATWINVTSNLPVGVGIIKIYHDVFSTNEAIYVCTAKGVYYKDAGMVDWQNISYNLPTVADIHDMMIYNPGTAASVLRVGYYGRGVWELPLNTSMPPDPDFTANVTTICPGQSINFTDKSFGSPIAWNWSFPGGTPSSSVLENPTVTYSTGGLYTVTLTVTNANGSNSKTLITYINVSIEQSIPFSEGFTNIPAGWSQYDAAHDGTTWRQTLLGGGFGASTESVFFDNYNYDANGLRDELRTPHYNLSAIHPLLVFDRAYARWGDAYHDSLAVLASADCGATFDLLYLKGYSDLATAPDLSDSIFVPKATEWKKDTVDLLSYAGQHNVLFAFQNRGHYGQALYLDNINISMLVGIDENSMENNFSVFPNPNNGTFTVNFNLEIMDDYKIDLYNSTGQLIYSEKLNSFKGEFKKIIEIPFITKGIYFLNVRNSKKISSKKIVVE